MISRRRRSCRLDQHFGMEDGLAILLPAFRCPLAWGCRYQQRRYVERRIQYRRPSSSPMIGVLTMNIVLTRHNLRWLLSSRRRMSAFSFSQHFMTGIQLAARTSFIGEISIEKAIKIFTGRKIYDYLSHCSKGENKIFRVEAKFAFSSRPDFVMPHAKWGRFCFVVLLSMLVLSWNCSASNWWGAVLLIRERGAASDFALITSHAEV